MTPAPSQPLAQCPKHWRNETSGVLAAAIHAYLDNPDAITMRDAAFLRAYLRQWIDAPVWAGNAIDDLRADVRGISDGRGITRWIARATAMGIDPL